MTLRNQNRNTGFYKSENILHVMDLNRYKFSIEAKNKQASAVFIKVSTNFGLYQKLVCLGPYGSSKMKHFWENV